MPDVHDKATRSRNMRAIRGKDTGPELAVRKALHAQGFRYRLHDKGLPGKPDLVLPKHHAVVFVHGCFWHAHDCPAFKMPTEGREGWSAKIRGNVARDAVAISELRDQGWRVAVVWECSVRGRRKLGASVVARQLADWLTSGTDSIEIRESA